MKCSFIIFILSFFLFLSKQSVSQFSIGSCTSPRETFKTYLKNSSNIYVGLGTGITKASNPKFDLSGQVAINYFPVNFLEIGTIVKTTIATYKVENKTFFENNLYLRYHLAQHSCMNASLFAGAGLERSHAMFSNKNDTTNTYKIYSAFNWGVVFIPVKTLHINLYQGLFLNRPFRINFSIFWNFKSFVLSVNK